MSMRKKLIKAGATVALLVLLVVPLTGLLSLGQDDAAYDAEHMVEPMLALLAQSPQYLADVAVEPMMELEDAWDIEDVRSEAEQALVVGMRNGDAEMGYDSESRTFYCTLGMDGTEDWPELELFAQAAAGAQDMRVAWIDDYSYDYSRDAIREGYRYELLAYTDTEYAYFGVVFTGLPIVTLHVYGGEDALGETYIPARAAVSGAGYEAINTAAQVHLRGGGPVREHDKYSYRLEFHVLTDHGDKKNDLSMLGMPADSDWILISNATDATSSRNELAWSLWRDWNADGQGFMLQQTRMVEVFADDEYVGLYQIIQRIRPEEEIVRMGGSLATDCVTRVIKEVNVESRPVVDMMSRVNFWAELRYAPQGVSAKKAFDRFEPYWQMNAQPVDELTDEEFISMASRCTDVREMMEFYLFIQAAGLGYDNIFNNVYMWAIRQGDHYVYYCSPWDMDMAFMPMLSSDQLNLYDRQARRMLDLNVGNARQVIRDVWSEKRSTIITDDAMYQRIQDFEDYINASGAYLRESEKWYGGAATLNLGEISAFAAEHLQQAERAIEEMWPLDGA